MSVGAVSAEPFRSGLPAEGLRKAWPRWELECGYVYIFNGNTYRGEHWDLPAERITDSAKILHTSRFRPHGTTWEAVERKAAEMLGREDGEAGWPSCNPADCLMSRSTVPSDKRSQSVSFPAEMMAEISAEPARLDRSYSWVVQRAWKLARKQIQRVPGDAEVKP